jgi:hypothetical protein
MSANKSIASSSGLPFAGCGVSTFLHVDNAITLLPEYKRNRES